MTPSVDGAVTVAVRATTDCEAAHAVCTTGGDKLAGGASATVPGLPVFSVADATIEEAVGAELDFEVTLDRAASVRVAVRYKTKNGTATAGPAHETYMGGAGGWTGARNDCWGRPQGRTYAGDYVPVSGLLIFDEGTTARTVSVPVCVDAHDETSETMRLELTETVIAEGIWVSSRIEKGEAGVGTITNDGAMPREWLSRFGRTVGTQVLDALGGRFDGAGGAGGGSHVTVGGIPLTGAGQVPEEEETERTDPFALPEWATRAREAEARTLTMEELVLGSAFTLRAGADDGEGPAYTAWGRVARGGVQRRGGGARTRAALARRRGDDRVRGARCRVGAPDCGGAALAEPGRGNVPAHDGYGYRFRRRRRRRRRRSWRGNVPVRDGHRFRRRRRRRGNAPVHGGASATAMMVRGRPSPRRAPVPTARATATARWRAPSPVCIPTRVSN